MKQGFGVSAVLRALFVLSLIFVGYSAPAWAAVAANNPDTTAAFAADPNTNSTCDEDVYTEQYNALGEYKKRYEQELLRHDNDKDIVDDANKTDQAVMDLYFCAIKITSIQNLIGMVSNIAAGIMAMLIAAVNAAVTAIVNDIINSVCQAFLGAVQGLVAALCFPNFNLNIKIPSFSYVGKPMSGSCAGTPLITVTGGPPLTSPPLSYGASLPGTNWRGSVNVIK